MLLIFTLGICVCRAVWALGRADVGLGIQPESDSVSPISLPHFENFVISDALTVTVALSSAAIWKPSFRELRLRKKTGFTFFYLKISEKNYIRR